jgi:hypothetical protein
MGHQSAHGAPMGMAYPTMPLSSPSFSPGMQSYAPAQGVHQNYYGANPAMPATMKQEPYGTYGTNNGYSNMHRLQTLSISTDRHASLPQLAQYPYRVPTTPQSARPSLGGSLSQMQDVRSMESTSWDRTGNSTNHGNVYAANSTPQPHSAGPYQTHNPPWGMSTSPMPRTETPWTGAESTWNLDQVSAARHPTYQATPQANL